MRGERFIAVTKLKLFKIPTTGTDSVTYNI